jgi:glyoxylase-like metal-dependent hydrolase (beta-lactamase superfamily II)
MRDSPRCWTEDALREGAQLTDPHAVSAGPGGLPDYLPVPGDSIGPDLNADRYHVGRIRGELYWVTDGFYQSMLLSTRDSVVLVDAPPTIGHNLLRANGRPGRVTHLVYSHSHADHIGAAVLFGRRVERVAHVETKRLLRAAGDPNRPLPTVTFEDRHVMRVGGERLDLAYHGPNHSPDNIFIYAPRHSTLMVVDVLYPGWVPFKNLAVSQDIPGWTEAQRRAMQYPWTTLVGGHLGRLGTRADGDLQRQYVIDLEASARATLVSLDPAPFFGEVPAVRQCVGDLQDVPRRGRAAHRAARHRQVRRGAGRRRRVHRRQRLRHDRVARSGSRSGARRDRTR